MRRGPRKYRRGHVSGDALEALVYKHYKSLGYTIAQAKAERIWLGSRHRCARCGKYHPNCGAKPITKSHDFFGVVDLLGFKFPETSYQYMDAWLVVQCGPSSQAAKKRKDLDKHRWPPGTLRVVITPDNRITAEPGVYRIWQKRGDTWEEGRIEL